MPTAHFANRAAASQCPWVAAGVRGVVVCTSVCGAEGGGPIPLEHPEIKFSPCGCAGRITAFEAVGRGSIPRWGNSSDDCLRSVVDARDCAKVVDQVRLLAKAFPTRTRGQIEYDGRPHV